jgi:hypothetical protein
MRAASAKSNLELEAFSQSPATFSSGRHPSLGRIRDATSSNAHRFARASVGQRLPAPIATSRLRYHPLLTTPALSQDGTFAIHSYPVSPQPRDSLVRMLATLRHTTPDDRENTILTMSPAYRSVTPPLRSSRPSPPARAAPTSVFLSRTPARPPRPSTAGRSPAPSSTSRTSRATPRPSP